MNSELAVVVRGWSINPGTLDGSRRSSTESGDKSLFQTTIVLVCGPMEIRLKARNCGREPAA